MQNSLVLQAELFRAVKLIERSNNYYYGRRQILEVEVYGIVKQEDEGETRVLFLFLPCDR